MRVTIIAAIGNNGEIGQGGKLPWHLPSDLKHFKETTAGHPVIMGRRTWDSLPKKPLPGRLNIVVGRTAVASLGPQDDAMPVAYLDTAIGIAESTGASEAFVIGGAQLYEAALPLADRLILTQIHADFPDADTFFPITSGDAEWKFTRTSGLKIDNGFSYNITYWERA